MREGDADEARQPQQADRSPVGGQGAARSRVTCAAEATGGLVPWVGGPWRAARGVEGVHTSQWLNDSARSSAAWHVQAAAADLRRPICGGRLAPAARRPRGADLRGGGLEAAAFVPIRADLQRPSSADASTARVVQRGGLDRVRARQAAREPGRRTATPPICRHGPRWDHGPASREPGRRTATPPICRHGPRWDHGPASREPGPSVATDRARITGRRRASPAQASLRTARPGDRPG